MGADSKIEWTHHTFNPWWGCVKVSPACTNCYADSFAKRTGHNVWGPKAPRRFFGPKHHGEPHKWNRLAQLEGIRKRVFCASMADVFEHVAGETGALLDAERARLWLTIEETPYLDWLLLTKRPENIMSMIPDRWRKGLPENVWLGTTVENQDMAQERIPHLLRVPARIRFLSCEPLLGPVSLTNITTYAYGSSSHHTNVLNGETLECSYDGGAGISVNALRRIHWVICGGESGGGARPMQVEWARKLRDQCEAYDVAFHFKQWGEHTDGLIRIGKKKAGRLLDGRTWDGFPEVSRG